MATLYKLVGQFNELQSMAEDPEIDAEVIADTIEMILAEIDDKAEGYVQVIKQIESNQKAYDEEAKFFAAKAKACKRNTEAMKKALLGAMEQTGRTELEAGLFKIKVQNNGGVQPLTICGDVPENFKRIILEDDNAKIREYLEAGNTCDWAYLEPRGKRIAIK